MLLEAWAYASLPLSAACYLFTRNRLVTLLLLLPLLLPEWPPF